MAVAKGRISLTADYYEKRTDDLLLERPISGTSGFASVFDNVGGVLNKGWELGLTTVNIDSRKTDGFRWTTTLNLGRNINRVTALFNNQPFNEGIRDINRVAVGEQLGAFYTLHFTGVDPQTGDAIFEDRNHDGAITADDQTIVGSPWPDWTGGFTSTMNFKGFDLTGFLVINQGAEIFNAMRIFADNGGCTFDNQFTNVLQRWQKPGDVTNVPRASYDCASGADIISDRYVEDGSYWRLQDLTMGYRLPGEGGRRARVRVGPVLRLGAQPVHGDRLHRVLAGREQQRRNNVDSGSLATSSEIGLGTDFYAYPQPRTWTFGIQAGW